MASREADQDATQSRPEIETFENPEFGGLRKVFNDSCDDLTIDVPKGASSIKVPEDSEPWQVFTDVQFEGKVEVVYPGDYQDLQEMGLESPVKSFRKAPHQLAVKLFENHNFGGKKKVFYESCDDLTHHFPEGASSVIVNKHSQTDWEFYPKTQYQGERLVLKPGRSYPSDEERKVSNPVKSFRKAHFGRSNFPFF